MNELIAKRRSIRNFQPDKAITKDQINQLLSAAMHAPSACNSRPWEFYAITNRELISKIHDMNKHYRSLKNASAVIVIVGIPQTGLPEGFFPQCCGAATENILLEAVDMGLGSCWCGLYPKEEAVEEIRELLDIDEPKVPINLIAIGVPDESPECRGFFEQEKVFYID